MKSQYFFIYFESTFVIFLFKELFLVNSSSLHTSLNHKANYLSDFIKPILHSELGMMFFLNFYKHKKNY